MDMATTTIRSKLPSAGGGGCAARWLAARRAWLFAISIAIVGAQLGLAQDNGPVPSGRGPQTSSGSADQTQASPLLLGPADVIEVQVFNTPELSGRLRLDGSGTIRLPLGGDVDVKGLTPAQASTSIEKTMRDAQVMLDPHVTTFVTEYATQGITILGEVRSPGTYNLFGPHSLYDALSVAGGTTPTAGATITITHKADPEHPINIPVNSPNYSQIQRMTAVQPGDTILVSKAFTVTVVGDVGHPGTFYLQDGEPMSVLNALALAAGLNHTAKVSKASIIRPTSNGAQTLPVDLNKVMSNTEPNLLLQPGDVLVVPRSGLKVFLETAIPGATGAVTSAVASALIVR